MKNKLDDVEKITSLLCGAMAGVYMLNMAIDMRTGNFHGFVASSIWAIILILLWKL